MKPVVAIVGRANVGKSTLFNRIAGGSHAIVENTPGVTRDRLYRDVSWLKHDFTLIDTGGIEFNKGGGHISALVKEQVSLAIEEADIIVFVLSCREGITADDEEVASMLRKSGKPVIVAINKVDNFENIDFIYDYFSLALGEPYPVSASHGMNIGELLDAVTAFFPAATHCEKDDGKILVSVIGRPNVGKSSLVNRLVGGNRVIVSDIPGTTRDAIDTSVYYNDQEYVIIDTAGMRRKGRINEPTERYSVARSLRAIDRCDVAVAVLNAEDGIIEQDKKITGYAHQNGKGLLLAVNKWDAVEKDDKTMAATERKLRMELPFAAYALTLFISAKTGQRVGKILPAVNLIAANNSMRVSTSRLNEVLREALLINPPPGGKGRAIKIYYGAQTAIRPPSFVLFANEPELIHFSYIRYIENKIRESFDFSGTPIRIILRKRTKENDIV